MKIKPWQMRDQHPRTPSTVEHKGFHVPVARHPAQGQVNGYPDCMARWDAFDDARRIKDSLDRVEYLMALEERLTDQIQSDQSLTASEKSRLLCELEDRILKWEFGDEGPDDEGLNDGGPDDDTALAIYVRKRGPIWAGQQIGQHCAAAGD